MIIGINNKQELEIVDIESKEIRPLAILGNNKIYFFDKLYKLYKDNCNVLQTRINDIPVVLFFHLCTNNYIYLIKSLNVKNRYPTIHIFKDIESTLSFKEQVSLFSKVKGNKNLGCIFLPNNPYLVSDCRKEDVYIFNGKKNFTKPDFQTFGASFTLIQMKLFDYKNTIAKRPLNMIKKDFNKKDRESLFSTEYGDSLEKSMFMVKLGNKK